MFVGQLGLLDAIIIIFFSSDFSSKLFWAFSFCLKGPNILLTGPNYEPKFNFINIKKTKGGHKFIFFFFF